MPALTLTDNFEHRVPAWKKLGLKLKYARDDVEEQVKHRQSTQSEARKRKRAAEEHTKTGRAVSTEGSSKKLKRSTLNQSPIREPDIRLPSTTAQRPTSSPKKRKSVEFTSDTKTKDGDSIKQLYDAWAKEEKSKDPNFHLDEVNEALKLKPSKPKKTKKERKKINKAIKRKDRKAPPIDGVTQKPRIHPAIAYLTQHHEARKEWKFSKAKQSYLLKHLLELHLIPSYHNQALGIYIAGIESESTRDRLYQIMAKIRDEEPVEEDKKPGGDDANLKRKRSEYEEALEVFVDGLRTKGADYLKDGHNVKLYRTDAQMAEKLRRRMRAETVLWGLSQREDTKVMTDLKKASAALPQSQLNSSSSVLQARARKRKLRTTAVDDDDEEEVSSSSGSSSSESSDGDTTDDSESSDSASSSSSGSDSDSGSALDLDSASDSNSDSDMESDEDG